MTVHTCYASPVRANVTHQGRLSWPDFICIARDVVSCNDLPPAIASVQERYALDLIPLPLVRFGIYYRLPWRIILLPLNRHIVDKPYPLITGTRQAARTSLPQEAEVNRNTPWVNYYRTKHVVRAISNNDLT
jgi:hypothetical protein